MIKSIHIQNFKSLKNILMIPASLNLLMGLNGMGKSSFIQSLLLLRQNKKSGLAKFALNGSLTEIGIIEEAEAPCPKQQILDNKRIIMKFIFLILFVLYYQKKHTHTELLLLNN